LPFKRATNLPGIARAIARRGEIFDEFRLLAQESPRTYDLLSKTAGYMHHYEGEEGPAQKLSGTMRELIALCALFCTHAMYL
jgi:hypothetical protein